MNELEDKVYDILADDPTIRGYTGWVLGGDQRVYHGWPPEQVIVNDTYPAYITMEFLAPGPMLMDEYVQPCQYPDEVADLNVWANSALLRGQMAERIMLLFWSSAPLPAVVDTDTEIDLTSFVVKRVVQESAANMTELLEEGTRQITLWRKFMRLRFGPIYAKLMGE